MKAQQLKKSILQYATQGKLVPQELSEEPASVLLESIKEQKKQLIKDKVIKNEKALLPITVDEIPFEIPETWEWVRLGEISSFIDYRGKTPEKIQSGIRLITAKNIKKGYISLVPEDFISEDEYHSRMTRGFPKKGDLFFTTEAPMGSVAINTIDEPFSTGQRLITIQNFHEITSKFIMYCILSPNIFSLIEEKATGTTVKGIRAQLLKTVLFPLPPLNEQKRIVAKVEELFVHVDKYDVLEQEITALNNYFPINMEKSILQYAMQGKLVDQDANDESASVLLEKIKEEREQLIKDKVIKRVKALAPITDDEIPFEIPNSWQWVRLNEISNIGQFKSIKGTIIEDDEWVLDLEDIEKDSGILLEKVMKSQKSVLSNKYIFSEGNVLYGKLRPYLNKVIVADQCGYCTTEILPLDFGDSCKV